MDGKHSASDRTALRIKAIGVTATTVDLPALVNDTLLHLFGSIGGAIPLEVEDAPSKEAVFWVDKRDEAKLRAALTLVSSHDGRPLRLEVIEVAAA
ncbi:hypothetical protein D9Q98_000600 [Chlorella vulgaris]|uniref:Uncharacterized protein n=1 Tax=Chlorella vulgaris TaxID=3077 RepID=A0A9D4TYJ3_CHLVU|nr:hypothetical protein D9Q98_000600 [Chlorella vulgaris]